MLVPELYGDGSYFSICMVVPAADVWKFKMRCEPNYGHLVNSDRLSPKGK